MAFRYPIDRLLANNPTPRWRAEEGLSEMVTCVRSFGLTKPIELTMLKDDAVRYDAELKRGLTSFDSFDLVICDGWRRLRALKELGFTEVWLSDCGINFYGLPKILAFSKEPKIGQPDEPD
jgi:hypothetical protein